MFNFPMMGRGINGMGLAALMGRGGKAYQDWRQSVQPFQPVQEPLQMSAPGGQFGGQFGVPPQQRADGTWYTPGQGQGMTPEEIYAAMNTRVGVDPAQSMAAYQQQKPERLAPQTPWFGMAGQPQAPQQAYGLADLSRSAFGRGRGRFQAF